VHSRVRRFPRAWRVDVAVGEDGGRRSVRRPSCTGFRGRPFRAPAAACAPPCRRDRNTR
jgi:hypothetical protein